jgi:hypothetical protein
MNKMKPSVAVHFYNPSTREEGGRMIVSLRPAWLQSKTLSQKKKIRRRTSFKDNSDWG